MGHKKWTAFASFGALLLAVGGALAPATASAACDTTDAIITAPIVEPPAVNGTNVTLKWQFDPAAYTCEGRPAWIEVDYDFTGTSGQLPWGWNDATNGSNPPPLSWTDTSLSPGANRVYGVCSVFQIANYYQDDAGNFQFAGFTYPKQCGFPVGVTLQGGKTNGNGGGGGGADPCASPYGPNYQNPTAPTGVHATLTVTDAPGDPVTLSWVNPFAAPASHMNGCNSDVIVRRFSHEPTRLPTGSIDVAHSAADYTVDVPWTGSAKAQTFSDQTNGGANGLVAGSSYVYEVCEEDHFSHQWQPADSYNNCATWKVIAPPSPEPAGNFVTVCQPLVIVDPVNGGPTTTSSSTYHAISGANLPLDTQPTTTSSPFAPREMQNLTGSTSTAVPYRDMRSFAVNPGANPYAMDNVARSIALPSTPCTEATSAGSAPNALINWDGVLNNNAAYPWAYSVQRLDDGQWVTLGIVDPSSRQSFDFLIEHQDGQLSVGTDAPSNSTPMSFLDNNRPLPADYRPGQAITYRVCSQPNGALTLTLGQNESIANIGAYWQCGIPASYTPPNNVVQNNIRTTFDGPRTVLR